MWQNLHITIIYNYSFILNINLAFIIYDLANSSGCDSLTIIPSQ